MASRLSAEQKRRQEQLDHEDRRLRQRTLQLLEGKGRYDSNALMALRDDWEHYIAQLETEMSVVEMEIAGDRLRRQALSLYQRTSRYGGVRKG